jgi:MarR family transcriptional regulator, organic hydroperoxide resistance regulator
LHGIASAVSLLLQIRETYRTLALLTEHEFGAGEGRLHVGRMLADRGPCSQATLARLTLLDPAAITRHLRALEADGLVERRTSEHHNGVRVASLTPLGEAWFARSAQIRESLDARLTEGLQPEEVRIVLDALARLTTRGRELLRDHIAAAAAASKDDQR